MKNTALLAALLVGTLTAHAAPTPEDSARQQLAAIQKADYGTFVASMHPEALQSFKSMMMPVLDAARENKDKALAETFFAGASAAELKKMTPAEFFQKFFTSVLKNVPQMVSILQNSKADILGHVTEGTDRAHVVVRMQMKLDETAITKMDVISFQRDGDDWKALLSGEIQNMAATLKKQFAR